MATAMIEFRKEQERLPEFHENVAKMVYDDFYVAVIKANGSTSYPREVVFSVTTIEEADDERTEAVDNPESVG